MYQVIQEGDGEEYGPEDHAHLRDPDRRCILTLADIIEGIGPVSRLDRKPDEIPGEPGSYQKAPDLDNAPGTGPQRIQQNTHAYMSASVQGMGKCEEGCGSHTVTGIVRSARKNLSGPSGEHLKQNQEKNGDQKQSRQHATGGIEPVQESSNGSERRRHGLSPLNKSLSAVSLNPTNRHSQS